MGNIVSRLSVWTEVILCCIPGRFLYLVLLLLIDLMLAKPGILYSVQYLLVLFNFCERNDRGIDTFVVCMYCVLRAADFSSD